MLRKPIIFCFTALFLLCSSLAMAGGGQSYPNGSEAFMAGAVPPPGSYFLDYAYYYSADNMKDDNGDDIAAFDDVTVLANVFRFLWVSDKQILGGNLAMHSFLPILDVDLKFNAPVGPESKTGYSDTNVPYVIVNPFILAWHLQEGKLHIVATPADIYIPTGQDDGNMATVGHNFWTFEPVVGITYLAGGWEFSGKFMYDFNTTQDDFATVYGVEVDRDPGQEFHFDYSASYAINPTLRIGLNGYFYTQVTDDEYKLNDAVPAPVQALLKQDEGNHGQVFAMGPGIWYNHKNMFFSLRNQ
ncbi:MAG: hypothetical protein DSY80_02595, partial [Desulfocapsa sp.]